MTINRSRLVCVMSPTALTMLLTANVLLAQDNAERARRIEAPFLMLDFGKSLIKIPPARHFIEMEYSKIPRHLQSEVYNGLLLRLRREVVPYSKSDYRSIPDADTRIFLSFDHSQDDLVELSWVFLGQHLRMTSSINAMRLDIELDEIDSNRFLDNFGLRRRDRVIGLIAAIVRLEGENTYGEHYQIDLPWPEALEEGVTFSSNPDRSIRTLGRWHQRIDAFVHDGVLSILSYKHIPQMMMYRDGSKWFSDELREVIHQQAREQGKIPKEADATDEE